MTVDVVYADEWRYDSDKDIYINECSGEVMSADEFEKELIV
jgi:hypothetical protein